MCVYFLPRVSGGVRACTSACACGQVGLLVDHMMCGSMCCLLSRGPWALCLCVFMLASCCVYMSILGVCQSRRGGIVRISSSINIHVWTWTWSNMYFQSPAKRRLCRLPPCYHARVCVCVVFAKMDADFKPNFPSRRRASSSKTPLSSKYKYLQKNKFLWNDEWRAHFLIDNHAFLKSHIGGWPGFKGPRVMKFTQLINDHVSVQTEGGRKKKRRWGKLQ